MKNNCKQCSKQYTCNKEKCEPVWWHDTKNFGEIERKNNGERLERK